MTYLNRVAQDMGDCGDMMAPDLRQFDNVYQERENVQRSNFFNSKAWYLTILMEF